MRGVRVSKEVKRVKLLTLIELFLGAVVLVSGIVVGVMGLVEQPASFTIAGEGLLTLVFGARAALILNVPARIAKVVKLALVVLLLQIACLVAAVMLMDMDGKKDMVVAVCGGFLPALLTCTIMMLSRGIAKRAER